MSCPARTGSQMVGRSSSGRIGRLAIETHPPTGLAGHGNRTVRRCTGHGLGYEMRSVETDDAPHTAGGPGRRAHHRALFVLSRSRSEPSRLDRGPRRFLARAHWLAARQARAIARAAPLAGRPSRESAAIRTALCGAPLPRAGTPRSDSRIVGDEGPEPGKAGS